MHFLFNVTLLVINFSNFNDFFSYFGRRHTFHQSKVLFQTKNILVDVKRAENINETSNPNDIHKRTAIRRCRKSWMCSSRSRLVKQQNENSAKYYRREAAFTISLRRFSTFYALCELCEWDFKETNWHSDVHSREAYSIHIQLGLSIYTAKLSVCMRVSARRVDIIAWILHTAGKKHTKFGCRFYIHAMYVENVWAGSFVVVKCVTAYNGIDTHQQQPYQASGSSVLCVNAGSSARWRSKTKKGCWKKQHHRPG